MSTPDSTFFEEEAARPYKEAADPMHPLRLRLLFIEWAKALRKLRNTESIREKLLESVFYITPADRAAVLVDNSVS